MQRGSIIRFAFTLHYGDFMRHTLPAMGRAPERIDWGPWPASSSAMRAEYPNRVYDTHKSVIAGPPLCSQRSTAIVHLPHELPLDIPENSK